jgi:hypothetical protein
MALARRERTTVRREAHFGARGHGVIRIEFLEAMLQMLEQVFEEE